MNSPAALRSSLGNTAVAWHIRNLPARLRHYRSGPALAAAEAKIARALRRDGIAIAHANDLFPAAIFRELGAWTNARRSLPKVAAQIQAHREGRGGELPGKKGRFLVDLWGGRHELDFSHPFIRFSLSNPVLGVVNAYLGMVSKFREFFLEVTVPLGAGQPFASQRWHQDPDDRKLIKVFLYLNDVGESAGPFTYLKRSHAGGRWRRVFPFQPERGRHPDPAYVQRTVPATEFATATGPAGTIIFCDTSGVHRGGYAVANERIMFTAVFTTPASRLPRRYAVPSEINGARLDPRLRYAVQP